MVFYYIAYIFLYNYCGDILIIVTQLSYLFQVLKMRNKREIVYLIDLFGYVVLMRFKKLNTGQSSSESYSS